MERLSTKDISIKIDDNTDIPIRLYHPNEKKVLPLIIYYHGGSHVFCSIDTHDALCRNVAITTKSVVLSVGYRLAPSYPYPIGLNDCKHVANNINSILDSLNIDLQNIFIAGDSAGANLTVSVAHSLKLQGNASVKGLVLISPSVDYTLEQPSIDLYKNGPDLTKEVIQDCCDKYFSGGDDRKSASPLYFNRLDVLPPIYMAIAERDPLYDEAVAFETKLKNLGNDINADIYKSATHLFYKRQDTVQTQHLLEKMKLFIRKYTK